MARCSWFFFVAALAFVACAEDSTPEPATAAAAITWHKDVKPITDTQCLKCHVQGGIAPFAMDTYQSVKGWATLMAADVTSRKMPPWPADPSCRHYVDERIMTQADIDTIVKWAEDGAAEGDPATAPVKTEASAATLDELGPPDFSGGLADPYAPSTAEADDYRCFLFDPGLTEDRWMKAFQVSPDNATTVHHVLLFLVQESQRSAIDALDSGEPGAGYTCFGGPGTGLASTIGGWAPGNRPQVLPDTQGIRLPKGSLIVMQVHYNNDNSDGNPDKTGFELFFHEKKPKYDVTIDPLANVALYIPPGEKGDVVHELVVPNLSGKDMTLTGAIAHMHVKGQHIKIERLKADGSAECLVDIPKWDFHWQGGYTFLPGEEVTLGKDDKLRLTCTFDNSKSDAKLVTWGEGTSDEMCLGFVSVLRDGAGAEITAGANTGTDPKCVGYEACMKACDPKELTCAQSCSQAQSFNCSSCLQDATFSCGANVCAEPTGKLLGCFMGCILAGEAPLGCVVSKCPGDAVAYQTCIQSKVLGGSCNDTLSRCDVTF